MLQVIAERSVVFAFDEELRRTVAEISRATAGVVR